jgi:hypothetical protein
MEALIKDGEKDLQEEQAKNLDLEIKLKDSEERAQKLEEELMQIKVRNWTQNN